MYFGVATKLAMGSTQQTIKILGSSDHLLANGATVQSTAAGFLATATNIGTHTRSVFSVMPELNLKLGYNITNRCNVYVGYDFLAWTGVARPGEQIDHAVNLTRVPSAAIFDPNFGGPANPAPLFRNSDLYVHAFRVGVEWKY
jgi:hypothetical protein